ncbi:hypothetical protein [Kitasatospora griseola]|uniref:hypothetical protein n=1 Tax=Kitasatospora griseola TaxID=2064 RepID=UPI001670EBC6|nr:hypothetical protein [Kitasatospora griseola]GGR05720.1 hypothetical protein GCM10010195_71290 [Kitasatospora griseola]
MTTSPHDRRPTSAEQGPDALEGIVARVLAAVAGHGMTAISQVPSSGGPLVELGDEHMDPVAFTNLAAAVGARLFYFRRERFDPELFSDAGVPDGGAGPRLRALVAEASAHEGRVSAVEFAFQADGVLHLWRQEDSWCADLENRLDDELDGMAAEPTDGERRERARLSGSRVDQLVAGLLQLPEFRLAASQSRQRVVAYHAFPELVEAPNSWQVLEQAGTARQSAFDAAYEGWEDQLPVLAGELAQTASWQEATNQRTRFHRAQEFLQQRADGYPPARRLVDLLLDTPGLRPQRRR